MLNQDIINRIREEYEYLQTKDKMDIVLNEIGNIQHFYGIFPWQPDPLSVHGIDFTDKNNSIKAFSYAIKYNIDVSGRINIIQRGIFNADNYDRYDM